MNCKMDITGIILKTQRLVIRPWKETDLQDFYEYAKVDGVGQMAGWLPHESIETSRTILKAFIEGKETFALEYQGKVIGSLGIHGYDEKAFPELEEYQGRELGYVLSKDYWGQGLMPEAVSCVTDFLFREKGLDFLLIGHFSHNHQSARVSEKCGYHFLKTTEYQTKYGTTECSNMDILWNPMKK